MSEPIMRDKNNQALTQLEELLKRSDYFNHMMQTHRAATQRIIVALIRELVCDDPERMQLVMQALKKADKSRGSPSTDTEARRMTGGIRSSMQNHN